MTTKPAAGLDPKFINPFIIATNDVLTTMAGVQTVTKKQMGIKKDRILFGEISGIMGVTGNVKGSISLSFTDNLAKKLVASMLEMEPEKLSHEDIMDGVGELLNMISGNAKKLLSGTEFSFTISLPSVIRGPQHELLIQKEAISIQVNFEADGDEFALQISFDPRGSGNQ